MSWVVLLLVAAPVHARPRCPCSSATAARSPSGASRSVVRRSAWRWPAWSPFPHLGDATPLAHVFASTTAAGPPIELAVYVDPLSAVLLLLAHTVAFLVQVYSLGYLHGDPRYPSYAALVSLFTGAMTLVVVADDLWVLLVGWELMGACSYFLIAHHWELPEARAGAVKAFLMTRTADLGLLFAILVLGAALRQLPDQHR